jgi:hypothetical protein
LRNLFADPDRLTEGAADGRRNTRGYLARPVLRSEWLYLSLFETSSFRPGTRIQRVLKGANPLDIPGNDLLPALRRYYRFPVVVHGARLLETRQMTREESRLAIWQAGVPLEREGMLKRKQMRLREFWFELRDRAVVADHGTPLYGDEGDVVLPQVEGDEDDLIGF